jgi:hypothetical protein
MPPRVGIIPEHGFMQKFLKYFDSFFAGAVHQFLTLWHFRDLEIVNGSSAGPTFGRRATSASR